MRRGRAVLPWAIAAITPAMAIAGMALDLSALGDRGGRDSLPPALWLAIVAALTTPVVVGLAILRARRVNRIGWILVAGPLPIAFMALADVYSAIGAGSGETLPGQAAVGAVSVALWPAFYAWPLAIAFTFPDGRLPSPRWRPAARAVSCAVAAVSLLILVSEKRLGAAQGEVENPLRIDGIEVLEPLFWAAWALMLAGLFVGAAVVVVRYRRARGVERLQLTWLAWSAALIPLGLVVCAGSYLVVGGVDDLVVMVLLGAGTAVSVSVGIAVTRHGLYEIDRIVNRTLVYACLTALLAAAFAAVVLAAGVALGRGAPVATALATLVVAVAFRPLRDRVQRAVDRRFARSRYEGLRRVRGFEEEVRRGAAEPEGVQAALAKALGDPTLAVWLRLPQSDRYVGVGGAAPAPGGSGDRARTLVARHGEELAVIEHEAGLRERPDLLRSVVDAASLTIEVARLRAEVREQLAEVEASRERLLRAGDEERRRLERDLHDGAQQRLVGLGLALRRMQRSLPREARLLVPALDQAVDEIGRAIADLRTIAAGLRPPRLDDGLAAALGDLARSTPLPVSVRVAAQELPAPIEVAAYYTVCEAVTNAVKHASATRIEVEAFLEAGRLLVRVRDDGAGGAEPRAGSGLAGIADRLGAHGGRLRIESPPGAGTTLEAELPCAS